VVPFEQLRRVLLQSRSLRELSVDVYQDPGLRELRHKTTEETRLAVHERGLDPTKAVNTIQIPLDRLNRLPSLEVLIFKARTYALEREHCIRLHEILARGNSRDVPNNLYADYLATSSLECMDWSKLKRLALVPPNPMAFFETFNGKLPMLEHLNISYYTTYSSGRPDLSACSNLLASLSMLKALTIRCDKVDLVDEHILFWITLLFQLGKRL
jgi:hypothetical protein